jgi:hypothetical protein
MTENCARPGCGHDQVHKVDQRISELLVRVTAERGHCGNGCRECSCPGYRTPEQQEAWERAALADSRVRRAEFTDEDWVTYAADGCSALRRLLEAYP